MDTVPDLEARRLRSEVRRRLFGDDDGERVVIGRFRVLEQLGRGGMGIVYAAYDTDLDRRVALKVLRTPGRRLPVDPERQRRLLREAQAMARLSHPNVVAVHEVGTHGDTVYVAMELLKGVTLRKWRKQERTWAEVVTVFVQAGRALAAAHQAGIVHRDFKPDNVMVGSVAGRVDSVHVLDFGLARAADPSPDSQESFEDVTGESAIGPLTETGTVLGTPAYMSPEQRERKAVGPASDQYNYCVALFEALHGHRPADENPARKRIPNRLRRVIDRGLRPNASDRWPTMAELVDELEDLIRPTRWHLLAGAAALIVAVAGAGHFATATNEQAEPCPPSKTRTDEVWNPERRAQVATAFEGQPYGADAGAQIAAALDERVDAWVKTTDESCEATLVRNEQTAEVHLWRSLCLESQLSELDALVALVTDGEADVLEHASAAADALPLAYDCSPDRAGRSEVEPPADAAIRDGVRAVRAQLAVASAAHRAGRYERAHELALRTIDQAKHLEYAPLRAEAKLMQGKAEMSLGRPEEAEATLYAAIEDGEASHHDEVVAEAWINLISTVGITLGRHEDALRLVAPAQGAADRLGDDPRIQGVLLRVRGNLLIKRGEFAEAIELLRRSLAILEAMSEDHPEVAATLGTLAKAIRATGDHAGSLEPARRALEIVERRSGARHPAYADQLTAISEAEGMGGDATSSREGFLAALAIYEAALGRDHPRVAAALHNVANATMALRRHREALDYLRRARAIDERHRPDDPNGVASLYAMAMAHRYLDEPDEAQILLERGLQILERAWGPEHPDVAYVVAGLGNVAAHRKDYKTAIEHFNRCQGILGKALGARHPRIVHSMVGESLAHLELGRSREAAELLEETLSIAHEGGSPPSEIAEVRFALARALTTLGRDEKRAMELAQRAHDDLFKAPGAGEFRAEIAVWLAAHG